MKYKLHDLIDMEQFQNLQDRFNAINPFPAAIIDIDGEILTATNWQEICVEFHRKNDQCLIDCIHSDQYIHENIEMAKPAVTYTCPRGLVDSAIPIIIEGVHYGNFFTGQIFLSPPDLEFFRNQATQFGFNEEKYLEAVKKVPVWTREQLRNYQLFIEGLLKIVSDTGLKKLKEAESRRQVEENQEMAKTILEQMHDGLWIADGQNGKIIEVNQAMCQMLGYSREEILNKSAEDFETNIPASSIKARDQEIIKTGSARFEANYLKKGGANFDAEVSVKYLPSRNVFYSFHRDISARKKGEAALRKSEANLKKAQHFARVGSWTWDVKTNLVEWSDEMFSIFGVDRSTFTGALGDIMARSIHPDDQARVDESNASVIYDHKPIPLEYRVIWPDGSVHPVWAEAGEMLFSEDGSVQFLSGTVQDITERKKAEAEIQAAQTELQRLLTEAERSRQALLSLVEDQNEAKEEIRQLNTDLEQRVRERTAQLEVANRELEAFSYSVSHDLRSPLRGVDGWSLALREDYYDVIDETGREYIDRIRTESQRMGHLIDDLLSLSRVSRVEMRQGTVNLSHMVRTTASRLADEYPGRLVEIVIQEGLVDNGDPNLLEVVFSNLLANAYKFTGKVPYPRIEFGQTILNGASPYFIKDNGAGFDMAYSKNLFGAFQRLHRQTEFPGSGIGLATVQRVIRRHGGSVWAEAKKDEGACFYFTLGEN
jgi:PAS domain S-box-containing protein